MLFQEQGICQILGAHRSIRFRNRNRRLCDEPPNIPGFHFLHPSQAADLASGKRCKFLPFTKLAQRGRDFLSLLQSINAESCTPEGQTFLN